ncbi:MAG: helix-turn-helix transcriptional regulator [Planctomycetes bacterium]|nr:helix-turn-helix transcriptional regulator [Planctomycetota bacterium]
MQRPDIARRATPLGHLLKHWRATRGMSQLALSLQAEVSPRHVSFVESGRSQPSRDMVLRLAAALHVPLREQNALLSAAGFAPVHRESALADEPLAAARQALDLILAHQEPFPAVVMDRYWHLVRGNDAAQSLFGELLGDAGEAAKVDEPPNVLRLVLHPERLRPAIANWQELAPALIDRVHRESPGGVVDDAMSALLDELTAYPGVADAMRHARGAAVPWPVVPVHFRSGTVDLRFFSAVTTLGSPGDVTLQELRVECFFPADAATATAMQTRRDASLA